jgi:hypothetical protein
VNLNLVSGAKQVLSAQEGIFKIEKKSSSKLCIALIVVAHTSITSSERPGANLEKFRKKFDKIRNLKNYEFLNFRFGSRVMRALRNFARYIVGKS